MAPGSVALSPPVAARPTAAAGHPKRTRTRRALAGFLLFAPLWLVGCARREPVSGKSFVGKWKSSRLMTPLHLHDNGEWEILQEDGAVLEYGIWEYKDDALVWTYKTDGQVGYDRNVVLSVTPRAFRLREKDGSMTDFARLD